MKKLILIVSFFLFVVFVQANNVQINNVSTVSSASVTQVEFDLSWANSWRTSILTTNWDAVWIFIKYKDATGWKHLDLTGANNTISAGYTVTVPTDKKGAFIYRTADGTGNVSILDMRLGVTAVSGTFDVQVFGIEMVYIPQGSFYIGDGAVVGGLNQLSPAAFYKGTILPAQITTALNGSIRAGGTEQDDSQIINTGIGIDGDGGLDTDNNGIIDNALYPTGYNSFYCMKYETSARAYCDFLNTLTYNQQISNTYVPPNSAIGGGAYPGFIEIVTPGINSSTPAIYGVDADEDNIVNESTDGEWKALPQLDWGHLSAYLDWATLRPMTELEYEKICRGPNSPVHREFAWGTSLISSSPYTVINENQASESVSNPSTSSSVGNAIYLMNSGSIGRNGIFATASSGRVQAGAAYYGVMEMTLNAGESGVSVGNLAGRSYTGKLGNGQLNAAGNADVDFWPGINGNTSNSVANTVYLGVLGITQNSFAGACTRGTSFLGVGPDLGNSTLSSRAQVSSKNFDYSWGGRGVR